MINVPELNLPHYNILIAQEDWLYQILNYIIGRSSLRLSIIGLILNLQFHGEWLKLTRLNQIDFKIFYLLAQEKKGIIINLVRLWLILLKSGKRLNVGQVDPSNFVTVLLCGTILILYVEVVHLSNPLGLL